MEASTVTDMLAEQSAEELAEMATRISRSMGCLEEALTELQAEQQDLNTEKAELLNTIDFMMKELKKLNIGSDNLVEPQLADEGPVEYIARLWEKMRPRELSGPVSENMGGEIEVRKPKESGGLPFEDSPAAQRLRQQLAEGWLQISQATKDFIPSGQEALTSKELGKQVAERGQELGRQLSGRVAGIYSEICQAANSATAQDGEEEIFSTPRFVGQKLAKKGQKFGKKMEERLSGALSFLAQAQSSPTSDKGEQSPGMGSLFAYLRDPGHKPEVGPDSAGPDAEDDAAGAATSGSAKDAADHASSSSSTSAGSDSKPPSAEVSRANSDEFPESSPTAPAEAVPAVAEAPAPQEKDQATKEQEAAMAAAEESTLLIQVQLKLGDGSVQVCEVRAADRCREVAARFVREHSLKAWFEQPLEAYLKEAERNAESFPVKLEADLMEIRKQYPSKKK